MKILFIGDISGKIGRKAVGKILPGLKRKEKPDLVIANADNIAHGGGITENTLKELMEYGVDFFTNGDHAFDIKNFLECYDTLPIIRPDNFSSEIPGKGYDIIKTKKGKVLVINLIGRVYMKMNYECPFRRVDEILAKLAKENLSAIIIDIHAETTSEKVCMGHYVDGRVSAMLGTHTHVMTADKKITEKGMAYITDVGMVGAANESLGIEKDDLIKTFLTQIRYAHVIPKKGKAEFNAVLLEINPKNRKAKNIKTIKKFIEIK